MTPGERLLAGVGLGIWLAVGTHAVAGERTHTVRSGESASSIAKAYYGSVALGDLLLQYNEKSSTTIQVGEKFRIPYCEIHSVESGDSWSVLAQRYLRRASTYPAVAMLNGLSPRASLRIGSRIVFPVVLPHRLERGETLAVLAERYYEDVNLSEALQSFNQIEDPRRLSVGQALRVPLISMRLRESASRPPARRNRKPRASKPSPTSIAAADRPTSKSPTPGFGREIRLARTAFDQGDYGHARKMLESLRRDVDRRGSKPEKAEVLRLLAFVYVAFDLPDDACSAYRSLARSSAETGLDADLVSPKIRDALSRCGSS